MGKTYIFKTYEELMEKMVGSSDPSIGEFIAGYRDVKYTSLFDRVIVDVHDVRIGEYLDRKSSVYALEGVRMPIMKLHVSENGGADGSGLIDVSDTLEMTLLFVINTFEGYEIHYFYNSEEGSFYSAKVGLTVTTILKEDIGSLRELFEKLLGFAKVTEYVFEEFNFSSSLISSYIEDRIGAGGDKLKFDGCELGVYTVTDDKGGRVTTMGTVGLSNVDSQYEIGERLVGIELLAGRLNDREYSNDWFNELVYDLYMSKVPLSIGFYVTGLGELEKINDHFAAVVMIPPSLWDSFELLHVEDRGVLWLWAVPITKRELKVLQTSGVDVLLEEWNNKGTQLLDLTRRDKRFKFF